MLLPSSLCQHLSLSYLCSVNLFSPTATASFHMLALNSSKQSLKQSNPNRKLKWNIWQDRLRQIKSRTTTVLFGGLGCWFGIPGIARSRSPFRRSSLPSFQSTKPHNQHPSLVQIEWFPWWDEVFYSLPTYSSFRRCFCTVKRLT